MRHTQIFAMTLATMLLAAGCSKPGDAATGATDSAAKPVAIVDGTAIPRDVWNLYVKTRHNGKTPEDLSPEQRSESLEELIGMYVGAQEAEKKNLASGEPAARVELMRNSAMADLLFKKLLEGKDPTEEELKAEYELRVAAMPKLEYHARHILVDDEAKAKDMVAQIDKGAAFEKLAEDHSKDGSASQGGDLGWFLPGQMVKPFGDAVQQLEVGKYTTTPVQSEFGWHVIKLEETRATTPPPYESVKAQLGPMVNQKKFESHLKELVKLAKVERSP